MLINFILMSLASTFHFTHAEEIRFLTLGVIDQASAPYIKDNQTWLGMTSTGEIQEVKISVKKEKKQSKYDPQYLEIAFKEAHAANAQEMAYLFQGINTQRKKVYYPPNGKDTILGVTIYPGQHYWESGASLRAFGNVKEQSPDSSLIEDYEIKFKYKDKSHTLIKSEYSIEYPFRIHWMGDLNEDHHTDFIIELDSSGKGSSKRALFLSAPEGETLKYKKIPAPGHPGC